MDPWDLGRKVMLLLQKVSLYKWESCSVCFTLYLLCFALSESCLKGKNYNLLYGFKKYYCIFITVVGIQGPLNWVYMLLGGFIFGEVNLYFPYLSDIWNKSGFFHEFIFKFHYLKYCSYMKL